MNGMDVFSYIESAPVEIAVGALHYCSRAFDHAQWPKERRPDIFFEHPSCLPSPEVRKLTLAILAAIEADAKREIDQLDKKTFDAYWDLIGDAGDILDARHPDDGYSENVEKFFRMMDEKWNRPARSLG
ncbi:hypothetical protein SAMN05216319_2731 [Duganella sp. CF402]|uniref:hypothetical protein n=1 Tax=unclassified Duganella TaxID=2636909 RepID=UPI0008B91F77|nr:MULTISPECIES: hypothetical protein [unclassified Duganella]RZT08852.1 hypothetical protein EV582_0890 [Duganella sp. BK701]SEL79441.1 hypothetical protein SAMN05216319_2731 [Duganella sp. CF402]